jgi:hypothetical protein
LSLLTGYVSAQLHLKHDDFFETVRDVNAMPQSKWQELAQITPEEMTGKPLLPSAPLGPPFNQGEQPYLLVLPLDQGEHPFLQNSSWSKSMQCLMTQMQ